MENSDYTMRSQTESASLCFTTKNCKNTSNNYLRIQKSKQKQQILEESKFGGAKGMRFPLFFPSFIYRSGLWSCRVEQPCWGQKLQKKSCLSAQSDQEKGCDGLERVRGIPQKSKNELRMEAQNLQCEPNKVNCSIS